MEPNRYQVKTEISEYLKIFTITKRLLGHKKGYSALEQPFSASLIQIFQIEFKIRKMLLTEFATLPECPS